MLPTIREYSQYSQKDNSVFSDIATDELDENKWEDRFHLLIRIMRNSQLEKDNRPTYGQFLRSIAEYIKTDLEDDWLVREIVENIFHKYCGKYLPTKEERAALYEIVKGWERENHNHNSLSMILYKPYTHAHPSSSIEKTHLGKYTDKIICDIKEDEKVLSYCEDIVLSFCSTIEQLHQQTCENNKQGKQPFLYTDSIKWGDLLSMCLKIDDIEWFYRTCLGYLTLDHKLGALKESSYYFHYATRYGLFSLMKCYGISATNYVGDTHRELYDYHWIFQNEDMYLEMTTEFRETHDLWISHCGDIHK